VAVIENGAVQELHLERALERGLVGNVYLGKVARVLPGMQSAFIDIGLERAAFLHVADLHNAATGGNGRGARCPWRPAAQVPIERQVFEGQTLTVQVVKDPIGTKGARLSTQVSIAGRMLVHLPQDNHIGISQKIGSPELREQLRQRMHVGGQGGGRGGRRLHPAHQCRGRDRRRAGRRHRLPAQDLGRHPRPRAGVAAGHAAAPGPDPGRTRAARPGRRRDAGVIRIDSRLQFEHLKAFGDIYMPGSVASCSTTPASGRSSTSSASRRRSARRWRAGST
jgi:ribonuclease G